MIKEKNGNAEIAHFFRNGAECDFCALTMERVECYETACADFEDME